MARESKWQMGETWSLTIQTGNEPWNGWDVKSHDSSGQWALKWVRPVVSDKWIGAGLQFPPDRYVASSEIYIPMHVNFVYAQTKQHRCQARDGHRHDLYKIGHELICAEAFEHGHICNRVNNGSFEMSRMSKCQKPYFELMNVWTLPNQLMNSPICTFAKASLPNRKTTTSNNRVNAFYMLEMLRTCPSSNPNSYHPVWFLNM